MQTMILRQITFCWLKVDGLMALMEGEHIGPFNLGNPGEFTMLELAEVSHDFCCIAYICLFPNSSRATYMGYLVIVACWFCMFFLLLLSFYHYCSIDCSFITFITDKIHFLFLSVAIWYNYKLLFKDSPNIF